MAAPAALTLQFLAWIGEGPRPYAEVMEAWRTNCPKLSVWEDALLDGLVRIGAGNAVRLTPQGRARLAEVESAAQGPRRALAMSRTGRGCEPGYPRRP